MEKLMRKQEQFNDIFEEIDIDTEFEFVGKGWNYWTCNLLLAGCWSDYYADSSNYYDAWAMANAAEGLESCLASHRKVCG